MHFYHEINSMSINQKNELDILTYLFNSVLRSIFTIITKYFLTIVVRFAMFLATGRSPWQLQELPFFLSFTCPSLQWAIYLLPVFHFLRICLALALLQHWHGLELALLSIISPQCLALWRRLLPVPQDNTVVFQMLSSRNFIIFQKNHMALATIYKYMLDQCCMIKVGGREV